MIKQKLELSVLCIMLLIILSGCNQGEKKENNKNNIQTAKINKIEIKTEIEKWKQELLKKKQIGSPCDYESLDSPAYQKWREENPKQFNGLPSDDKEIKSVSTDFNNDHKEDILLLFQGKNCTGHNGGTKTYAKIIYSDGTSKSNLMTEIINGIQSEYNQKKKKDKKLKEITSNYLETTTTIYNYNNGITGTFFLYAKDDPHCCPTYKGSFIYKLKIKNIAIEVSENK